MAHWGTSGWGYIRSGKGGDRAGGRQVSSLSHDKLSYALRKGPLGEQGPLEIPQIISYPRDSV